MRNAINYCNPAAALLNLAPESGRYQALGPVSILSTCVAEEIGTVVYIDLAFTSEAWTADDDPLSGRERQSALETAARL